MRRSRGGRDWTGEQGSKGQRQERGCGRVEVGRAEMGRGCGGVDLVEWTWGSGHRKSRYGESGHRESECGGIRSWDTEATWVSLRPIGI